MRFDVLEGESRFWFLKIAREEGKENRVRFVIGKKYVDGRNKFWCFYRMIIVNKMYCILKWLEERILNGFVIKKLLKFEIIIC